LEEKIKKNRKSYFKCQAFCLERGRRQEGADKLKSVSLTFPVVLGLFIDFVVITHLLFVLACPFGPESINVKVPKKTSNQNPYKDKPYKSADQRVILSS
jgi:hypothetical protein